MSKEVKEIKFEGISEPREISFTELCERLMIPEFSKMILAKVLPEKFTILPPTISKDTICFAVAYDITDNVKVEGKLKVKNIGESNWKCELVTSEAKITTKGKKKEKD